MQASVHRFDEETASGSVLLDDGRECSFATEVFLHSGLRHLRVGQRLSVDLAGSPPADGPDTVSRLWIVGIGDGEPIR